MEDRQQQGLSAEGQARRRFLKQAGTVAWASPLILTMMSRTAHAQLDTVCGEIDIGDNGPECVVMTPCASPQLCVPSPNPFQGGDCVCVAPPA